MEGSYEFVQCFIAHAMDHLCPLDLLVLKRVSKTFYKYICKYYPNFGIERNLFRFAAARDKAIVKPENIRTGLDNGLTLFGSYLQSVMLKPFGSRPLFTPKDVDFFCLDRQLALHYDLLGKEFSRVPVREYDGDSYEKIQCFEVLRKGPFDLTIGTENGVFHIGKSDFPFQRMFFSRRTGFQTESLAGLLAKEQEIPMPSFPTRPKSCRFVLRVLEFAHHGICPVVITFDSQSSNLYGFGVLLDHASTCSWDYPDLQVSSRIEENRHLITIFTRL